MCSSRKGNSVSGNNTSQNVKQLTSSIELVSLMDEDMEDVNDGFADHFSALDQLGIQTMQNVFEVLPFMRFFTVEKLKELLHEFVVDECT